MIENNEGMCDVNDCDDNVRLMRSENTCETEYIEHHYIAINKCKVSNDRHNDIGNNRPKKELLGKPL